MSPPETEPRTPRWTESTIYPDMWADPDHDPRETEVDSSDERAVGADLPLRDMLVAQVAEDARHCGHADLLRERIDGRVGQ